MKTHTIQLLALIITIATCFTACEKATEPQIDYSAIIPDSLTITTEMADWDIKIFKQRIDGYDAGDIYAVKVKYIKNPIHQFSRKDNAVLVVNKQTINLTPRFQHSDPFLEDYYGSVILYPNSNNHVEFYFNGKAKLITQILAPSHSEVTFPQAFSPHDQTDITWSTGWGGGHFQDAGITSYYCGYEEGGIIETYKAVLDSFPRSFSFPGECVAQSQAGYYTTDYKMWVNQISCLIVNRVALTITTGDSKTYGLINDNFIPTNVTGIHTVNNGKWVVALYPGETNGMIERMNVLARCVDTENLPAENDTIQVRYFDNDCILQRISPTSYSGIVDSYQGCQTTISLLKNDQYLLNHLTVYTPYKAEVIFPADYNPAVQAELTWWYQGSNIYQFLDVNSYRDNGTETGLTSGYFRQLNSTMHNYTIPSDAVEDFGIGTAYSINLARVYYEPFSPVTIVLLQETSRDYGSYPLRSELILKQKMDNVFRLLGPKNQ